MKSTRIKGEGSTRHKHPGARRGRKRSRLKRTALELVEKLPERAVLLPVQTLGELFNLLVRKAARPPEKARKAILSWRDAFSLIETSAEVLLSAADLATDHQL